MEAVAATAAPADETSVARSRAGELTAFKERYRPEIVGVYDFALRIVRDRGLAEEVVRRTFARAWDAFPERELELFAAVQDHAYDALRYRERRNGAEREALHFTRIDAGRLATRSEVSFDRELVELVWDEAAALSVEEYALLALDVRHGVGSQNGNGARAARAREAFDARVLNELVARRARHTCSDLQLLYVIWETVENPRVREHIGSCARCQASKRSFVAPSDVLGALAPIRPAPELEAGLWRDLERSVSARRRRRFGIL